MTIARVLPAADPQCFFGAIFSIPQAPGFRKSKTIFVPSINVSGHKFSPNQDDFLLILIVFQPGAQPISAKLALNLPRTYSRSIRTSVSSNAPIFARTQRTFLAILSIFAMMTAAKSVNSLRELLAASQESRKLRLAVLTTSYRISHLTLPLHRRKALKTLCHRAEYSES